MSVIYQGESHYAPEINEAQAVQFAEEKGMPDVLVLRFHSDNPLIGIEERSIGWMEKDRYAYDTVRWGSVYGWAYAIPCRDEGERDAEGRPVYADEKGVRFAVEWQDGSPECPASVYLRNV